MWIRLRYKFLLKSKNVNYNYSQTALSITYLAIFSLKIFQQKMAIFTKCNFFGQSLVFLPLRKPDLYISRLQFIVEMPPSPPLFKGAEINFDYPPPHPPGREGIWKNKNRGWKYGAGAGLLKRRGWHFSNLNFSRFIIFTFRNYLSLDKIVFLSREKFFIFVCHHGFMKKGYSKLSKNEPENIL